MEKWNLKFICFPLSLRENKVLIMLIDFHTHLDFYNQTDLAAQLAEFSGTIIAASVDENSFLKNCEIASHTPDHCHIISTFGIHPNYADENVTFLDNPETKKRFEKYLEQSSLIGEIGMDFCWSKCSAENQEKVLRYFLEYCNKTAKPCVIHTKAAEQKICDILSDYPDAPAVIHWYDGPENIYREFLRRGYMQTFGVETIRSEHLQKLLKMTPPELLLAETDNPDSEPWLGGTRNDVGLIERVYNEIAELLGMSRSAFEKLVEENFNRILPN